MPRQRGILLTPRSHLAYGQDFHTAGLQEHCDLTILTKPDSRYQWIERANPELVISQNPNDPDDANFFGSMGDEVAKVAHIHCRWEYFSADEKKIVGKTLANATLGIVPAKFHREEMSKLFPNIPWRAASNGVRPDLFRPASQAEREEFKAAHLIDPGTKLVGYTGRIEGSKGIGILKQICMLIEEHPFAVLVQFAAWQAIRERKDWSRTEEFMHQLKAINPRKVVVWPDTAPRFKNRPARFLDVFLTPSLSEVQPLVVLEALLSGVPVVATDSTPFYDELRQAVLRLPESYLQVVPLDDRFNRGAVSRTTAPTENEAKALAKKLIEKINAIDIRDYAQREAVSALMLEANYSEAAMNARIAMIYEEAIEYANAKSKGVREREIYPLKESYVRLAPLDVGAVEIFYNGELVEAETSGEIRSVLLSALLATDRDPGETTFRFRIGTEFDIRESEERRERTIARTVIDRRP